MASFLRPRRGKKSTATSDGIILKRGEVFFEVPDTGVGTGNGKIKMGDGTTSYASLPYFLDGSGSGSGVIRLTEEEWEALTPEQQASGAYVVDFDEEEGTTNAELAIKMNQIMNKTIPTNGIIAYDVPEGGTIPEGFVASNIDAIDEINDNLTQYDMDNAQYLTDKFRFATKNGKDGYIKKVEGADTFFPFSPKADLLWTNPNPSTTFNSQTVSIDLTDYESVLIAIKSSVSADNLTDCIGYFKKGATISGYVGVARPIPSTIAAFGTRLVTAVTDNGVSFGVFKYGTTQDNTLGVPIKIYGLKSDLIPS